MIPRPWRSPWTPRRRSPWAITSGGEKARTDSAGEVVKGWDHDPPAKAKLVPYGILMMATGALMLVFGAHDTSDAWVDALRMWWREVGPGLEVRLVYYPPYHSKYNPIERCWSALEKKWNGVLLNGWKVVLQCALRMRWKGRHPTVKRLDGEYPDGIRVPAREMKAIGARLDRSATLPKYDITIKPRAPEPAVK